MNKVLLIILLLLSNFLYGEKITNDINYFSPMVAYGDSSGLVSGHVNVISGDFVDYACDLVVPGPIPVTLERSYASGVFKQLNSPHHSWHFNYESKGKIELGKAKIKENGKIKEYKSCLLTIASTTGGENLFTANIPKRDDCYKSHISPLTCNNGVTNTFRGFISGQTNIKNYSFSWKEGSKSCFLVEGDGTRINYSKLLNSNSFYLTEKVSPNKEKICFSEYKVYQTKQDKWKAPQSIKAMSVDESIEFGNIKVGYNPQKNDIQQYKFKGSNGKRVSYSFKNYEGFTYAVMVAPGSYLTASSEDKLCLYAVESDSHPKVEYSWQEAGVDINGLTNERFRIWKKSLPENRGLEITYVNSNGTYHNRVKELKAPIGNDDKLLTSYHFKYGEGWTKAYDAIGRCTEYLFTDEHRIKFITRYMDDAIYTRERFLWGSPGTLVTGNLLCHWIEEIHGWLQKCTTYDYDDQGNVVKETIFGNLTGKNEIPIIIDHNISLPLYNGCENFSIYRAYSNNKSVSNLLISESIGNKKTELTYYPSKNLVKEKFILVDGQVKSREFFEYDHNHILIKTTVDDGSSRNSDDLSGVSERHVTIITPSISPIVGLPEIVEKYYQQEGQLILLTRTVNAYNNDGKLIEEKVYDADQLFAYQRQWDYDSHGNLIFEVDPLGNAIRKSYDANDNLIKEEGPDDTFYKTFEYDFSNRLIAEKIHTLNGKTFTKRYGYDLVSNKIWESDIYDNRTEFKYDDLNRLKETIYPDGSLSLLGYDLLNNCNREVDENGHVTTKIFNSRNQLIKEIFPDGTHESYLYSLSGLLLEKVECNGTRVTYLYDGLDRVIEEKTHASNGELLTAISKTYSSFQLLSETDANGVVTHYYYDGASRLIKKTKGDLETLYVYDSLGRMEKMIEGGRVTVYRHDLLNQVLEERVEDLGGNLFTQVNYEYDCHGNKIRVYQEGQAGTSQTVIEYDHFNRLIRKIDAEGNITSFHYHDASNLIEETDSNGTTTIKAKDVRGRIVSYTTKDPFGGLIQEQSFLYDPAGNLIEQVDSVLPGNRKIICRREYDTCNREILCMEAYGTPEQKITKTAYNSAGLKEVFTKSDGVQIHYSYDGLNRLIVRSSSDGTINETYRYDPNGNLLYSEDQTTKNYTERAYDCNNHLISERLANGLTFQYSYDSLGRITQMTLPDQSSIQYDYDAGYMRAVRRTDSSGVEQYRHTYDVYDASRRLCLETLVGNAGQIIHTYDLLHRPVSSIGPNYKSTVPKGGYDSVGNLLCCDLQDDQGVVNNKYAYDHLDQLIKEDGVVSHSYQCDSLSNRIQKNNIGYDVNSLNQILCQNKSSYEYDQNGNRICKKSPSGEVAYSYDALNRLVKVQLDDTTITYAYDTFNRRISRTDGSNTEYYIYREMDEIGSFVNGKIIQLKVIGLQNAIAIELEETVYTAINDRFSNVVALVSPETGETVTTYRYGAFGDRQQFGDIQSPWRYQQKRHDPTTDLVYFGYRDYDIELGTWSTPDPLGFADGPNLYVYVHHNPIVLCDFDGRFSFVQNQSENYTPWYRSCYDWGMGCKNSLSYYNQQYQLGSRFMGGLQAVGGLSQTALGIGCGIASAWSGVGAVAGAGIALHGFDNFQAGFHKAWTGQEKDTITSQFLQKSGMSQHNANLVNDGLSICSGVVAGSFIRSASIALKAMQTKFNPMGYSATQELMQINKQNSTRKISQIQEKISEWLGNDVKFFRNKSGDSVILSSDGTRKIRFDFNNPAPHKNPHGHVEELINGKWRKSGPIYPNDVSHY